MRSAALLCLVLVLSVISIPVLGQAFPDVPADHWAYQAVRELQDAGVVEGYPDGRYVGYRVLSRYEFAHALARAIPIIEEMACARIPVPPPPPAPRPPVDTSNLVPREQLDDLQRLADEFAPELEALGEDVDALRRDIVSLRDRVDRLEDEVRRVRFFGNLDIYGKGEIVNSGLAFDRDSRVLSDPTRGTEEENNPIANSFWFNNLDFGMQARVSETTDLNARFQIGNYMDDVLDPSGAASDEIDLGDFVLWNLNADAALWNGTGRFVAGRYTYRLTPFTLRFVPPDYYNPVPVLDEGDYVFDGASISFGSGDIGVEAFAAKANVIGGEDTIQVPTLVIPGQEFGIDYTQIGGARVVLGDTESATLGLTWYEAGLEQAFGNVQVYGADAGGSLGSVELAAEYAKSSPDDQLEAAFPGLGLGDDNSAWNAAAAFALGQVCVGAGYMMVERNFIAPGYWLRLGRAVNLQNVKGPLVDLAYCGGERLRLTVEARFLEPDNDGVPVTGRTAVEENSEVNAVGVDKINYWLAGAGYDFGRRFGVDLYWEQADWEPVGGGADTEEKYYTIALRYVLGEDSAIRLLYQIVDYEAGVLNPHNGDDYRGGVVAFTTTLRY